MRCRSLSAGLVVLAAFGCSNKKFQAKEGETGGGTAGASSGGADPTGGNSGDAGMTTGGNGGSSGTDPTGGAGGTPCTCAPSFYCRNNTCQPCAELAMLEFGPPEPLLDHPSASIRFPRAGSTPDSLFFRAGNEGAGQLWYTASTALLGALIGDPGSVQSGLLLVDGLDQRFNVIFDETSGGMRSVRGATWDGNALSNEISMPSPLSPGGWDDYSPAAASVTRRFYWMSTRDGPVTLRTGVLDTGEGDPVGIEIPKRVGSGTCPLSGSDATPWVTPDGRRMFLRAFPFDEMCQPRESSATDLFVVPLEPSTGMPIAAALLLANVNGEGTTETDPSLSPDLCTLYFASDRDSAGNPDFKLFRARRQ